MSNETDAANTANGAEPTPRKPDTGQIRSRALSGIKAYGMRYLMSVGLRIVSSLTLARLLFPEDYGPFVACSAIVGLGQYLCDVGVTTYLVWQDHEPTEEELSTAFWLQMLMTAFVVVFICALSPLLLRWFNTKPEYGLMLIVMAAGLFVPTLRNIPRLVLDRKLMFPIAARGDLADNVLAVVTTIVLAKLGYGAWALVLGGLAGRIANTTFTWAGSPWKPRFFFSRQTAGAMIRNGMRFHVNVVTPVALRSGGPIIVSNGLTNTGLGLFGWAGNQASIVAMLSSVLNQIALPTYSRLRSDPEQMGQASVSMAYRVGMLLSLAVGPAIVLSPVLIPLVFAPRWIPAVPIFQWLVLEAIITTVAGLHQQTQAAAGRLRDAFIAAVVGNIGRLVLLFAGIYWFGLAGAGPGAFFGALFEAGFLAWQLRKTVQGCGGIYRATFGPVLSLQFLTMLGVGVGWWIAPQSRLEMSLIGLGIFGVGVLLYDFLTGQRPVTSEIRNALRMLKSSRQPA